MFGQEYMIKRINNFIQINPETVDTPSFTTTVATSTGLATTIVNPGEYGASAFGGEMLP